MSLEWQQPLRVSTTPENKNQDTPYPAGPMGTGEGVFLAAITPEDQKCLEEIIRLGIGDFEEAGTVLASTFRRLEQFSKVYSTEGSLYIVAWDKNPVEGSPAQIIGGAGLGPLHGLSPAEGLGEIRDLVVLPKRRGQGIGARLLKRCLEEARNLGYQRLYLETTPKMEHAQKLFLRYGFRPITTGTTKITSTESMPCYYILENIH